MSIGTSPKKYMIIVLAFLFSAAINAHADFTFGEPTNLGPTINTSSGEALGCFSSDGLEMYFDTARSGGDADYDIWVVIRPTIDDDCGEPMNLGPTVNSPQTDSSASISFDGLELYFASGRPGGFGGWDLWVTMRPTKDDEWGTPINLGPTVNSVSGESSPWISTDGLELCFSSDRPGGYGGPDLWVATRATKDEPWGEPVNLGSVVNSSTREVFQSISADGLALFFSDDMWGSMRPGGFGGGDMWVTTRARVNHPWGIPVNLGRMVNSSSDDTGPRISPDGAMLYFSSERPGGLGGYYGDMYQAPILPIVDFNGDGIVDAADMCIMVDRWGTDYALCDIGPMPWGDGIVDVQDLIVLAEHLFEEVYDPTLVAHWKLDETEGDVAYDSAAENDAVVLGNAAWAPDDGMIDGALQFDGIDDYVSTEFVLNPGNGAFSVVAWVVGGAPGQVILSQADGASWLLVDPLAGRLMTNLSRPPGGRMTPQPLVSESAITDGNWHRIAFVWDGSHRALYVDDMLVAEDEDTQPGLDSAVGGLNIGCGSDSAPGTFWSGLIDDVRVYNRALNP